MNQPKQPTNLDLAEGRKWLDTAVDAFFKGHLGNAQIAAAIGAGYIALAQAAGREPVSLRLTSEMPPELITAVERAQRAAAEARPHDDEPKHALDEDVLWVVADNEGPIHAGTQAAAQKWANENRDDYEGLTVTAMEVDRG